MALYRRERHRRRVRRVVSFTAVVVPALGIWWFALRDGTTTPPEGTLALGPLVTLTTDRDEVPGGSGVRSASLEKGANPEPATRSDPTGTGARQAKSLFEAGKKALENGDLILARTYLSEALAQNADPPQANLVRAELTRVGNETIFSPRIFEGDPFVERYVIRPGDSLVKIARANKVSADLLAEINQIKNKNRIRAGQAIKIIKGPFRAVVHKGSFRLDLYLGNTFVRHYRVGLGADGSTPAGKWRVATKLVNPTYYPPRGGKIVAADDSHNPLGERWIGLQGISGEAMGQLRYGIHGTIEPDSVGKNVSMGCIRMFNEDVEALYGCLVQTHSIVEVRN